MTAKYRAWCDCSWHGEFRSQGRADYAMRRHSCELWEQRRANAKAAIERRANLDRTERPCTHKIARHEHGTYARFTLDHCHCDPCRGAKTSCENMRRRRRAYGEVAYVDARPATEHVRSLMAAGLGWKRVAAMAGLDPSMVYPLLYGRPDRNGGAPRSKARRTTVEALMSVPMPTLDDLGGAVATDPTGTARRVQALACLGWSVNRTAAQSGIDRQAIDRALRGEPISVMTARGIRDLYERLWATPAPERDQRERIAAARSRNRSTRAGWVPPMAWDDETIDDPAASPANGMDRKRGVDLDEWLHLVRSGEHPDRAARRCGVTLNTVEVAAHRAGRADDYTRARKAVA